ncbi:hypothetical protein OF83DRAFT_1176721 [Amylostereum chailletii]|nr:hypothetical protein OF83DRAFT_1176721 [Amylostereum chailletii]
MKEGVSDMLHGAYAADDDVIAVTVAKLLNAVDDIARFKKIVKMYLSDSGCTSEGCEMLANSLHLIATGAQAPTLIGSSSGTSTTPAALPVLKTRPFNSQSSRETTYWYTTFSTSPISSPPPGLECRVGYLYRHRNTTNSTYQTWLYTADKKWTSAQEDDEHPMIHDRKLNSENTPVFQFKPGNKSDGAGAGTSTYLEGTDEDNVSDPSDTDPLPGFLYFPTQKENPYFSRVSGQYVSWKDMKRHAKGKGPLHEPGELSDAQDTDEVEDYLGRGADPSERAMPQIDASLFGLAAIKRTSGNRTALFSIPHLKSQSFNAALFFTALLFTASVGIPTYSWDAVPPSFYALPSARLSSCAIAPLCYGVLLPFPIHIVWTPSFPSLKELSFLAHSCIWTPTSSTHLYSSTRTLSLPPVPGVSHAPTFTLSSFYSIQLSRFTGCFYSFTPPLRLPPVPSLSYGSRLPSPIFTFSPFYESDNEEGPQKYLHIGPRGGYDNRDEGGDGGTNDSQHKEGNDNDGIEERGGNGEGGGEGHEEERDSGSQDWSQYDTEGGYSFGDHMIVGGAERQDNIQAIREDLQELVRTMNKGFRTIARATIHNNKTVEKLAESMKNQRTGDYPESHKGSQGRTPHRRSLESKALADLIRREIREAFKTTGTEPFGPMVTDEELAEFTQLWELSQSVYACMMERFQIDIQGTPKSPWNVSAGRIFTKHVIAKFHFLDDSEVRQKIQEVFSTRVKSLRKEWMDTQKNPSERVVDTVEHRHWSRKEGVSNFHRRRDVARQYALKTYLTSLDALGPRGMSSDESDTVDGRTVLNASEDRRGQTTRDRQGSERINMSTPVKYLPLNFYNEKWLSVQPALYIEHVLQPAESVKLNGAEIMSLIIDLTQKVDQMKKNSAPKR